MSFKQLMPFLFIVLFVFVACEKEIKFNGKEMRSVLVLNSFVTPDSLVRVNLSKSNFFLQKNSFATISDATLKLYVNEQLRETMVPLGNGNYQSDFRPQIGDKIKIESSANDFETAWAETVMLPVPKIISVDTTMKVLQSNPRVLNDGEGKEVYLTHNRQETTFKVRFKDNAEEENFYFLSVEKRVFREGVATFSEKLKLPLTDIVYDNAALSEPFSVVDDEQESESRKLNIFTDVLFSGKEYTLSFSFIDDVTKARYADGTSVSPNKLYSENNQYKYRYFISLNQVTKDYYLYALSRKTAQNTRENLFVEPALIHNNIKKGIGILGAYTPNTKVIEIAVVD